MGWLAVAAPGLAAVGLGHSGRSHSVCDARDFGARGDGRALDTQAINRALQHCDKVELLHGVYKTGSLHLGSHQVLWIGDGATVFGAPNNISAYDPPEPNPFSSWQDFGHSHWQNSLMWAAGAINLTITGGGVVDGGGIQSMDLPNIVVGGGDKAIALKSCSSVVVSDLRMRNTGHFAMLATNVTGLQVRRMIVNPTRDGLDIVSCRDVMVDEVVVEGGGDDAVVLKSDYSLGSVLHSTNITVSNSRVGTLGATALEIGSESVGDFTHIRFLNITVTSAGDSGIGIANMDGSHVSDVMYVDIRMSNVTSAFQYYIGARCLRPPPCQPGTIVNVSAARVSARHMENTHHPGPPRNWSSTLDGMPATGDGPRQLRRGVGPGISFVQVDLVYRGGGLANDALLVPPHYPDRWFWLGVRPAYGWYIRNADGVSFENVTVAYEYPEGRPGMVLDNVNNVTALLSTFERGTSLDYDVGLRGDHSGLDLAGMVIHNLSTGRAFSQVFQPDLI